MNSADAEDPRNPFGSDPPAASGVKRRVRIRAVPEDGAGAGALGNGVATAGRSPLAAAAPPSVRDAARVREVIFDARDVGVSYSGARAIAGISMQIHRNLITALIGPSGCGKTTFLRSLNRMNDSVKGFELLGQMLYHGHDIYGSGVDPVEVRRRIGMVFQRPNPFPKSIYDNVAWAPRNLKMKGALDRRVEYALRGAALWDEVKDRLRSSALGLSGGQQQRLCIARAIAVEPDVLLLDEPASALDPIATQSIEDLMQTLKHRYTIVIVTHNMQQAARIADRTAFFSLDTRGAARTGVLVEYDDTEVIFTRPRDLRTSDYVTGRFG
jgi:phosphate transport system ATP-binding protein